ncbi:MAG: hypothetical protein Q4G14_06760 [Paracoccus sp. (in: a-proteobacteria)]|uniref:hypothetical protein n=1 Tax=Paracoccus sp. TaxID=267 RepID=UPI0026E0E004|nr:hypothetical protein [Paracoccus sp. (in: a-proteobacteria)]MDO5612928.1 hypothetical protein [Paracoccus sp. (in: a-proteobacteria)]
MSDLNSTTKTPSTLTGIFDQWGAVHRRLNDPETPEWEEQLLWPRERELCAAAAKIPAADLIDLSIKLVMDGEGIPPETKLMESAIRDARRVIEAARSDARLFDMFGYWNVARVGCRDSNLGEDAEDWIHTLMDGMANDAAKIPAMSARGLAMKIMMAGDMEMGLRPIVESTRKDILRLAGIAANDDESMI